MDKIVIRGGERLIGEVKVSGSKNATLPIFVACLLSEGENLFHNVPNLKDVQTIIKVLNNLGVKVWQEEEAYRINAKEVSSFEAPYDLVKTMRASILVLGPLVARMKRAIVSLPGGCAIGARPINLHLMGLEMMGAKIQLRHGYIEAKADELKGAEISFDTVTVTGTENLMMAGTLAKGKTTLHNAAMEPEVVDLASVLNKMGAKISGAGTNLIEIEGVKSLQAVEHTIIPDRIETGTLMVAAGLTRGNIKILNASPQHMQAMIHKLRESGMEIESDGDGLRVVGMKRIRSVDVKTQPYPGFPTDMQAQFMVLMSLGRGLSVISENIFENRFIHVSELQRMGADIRIQENAAIIQGVESLSGAPVMATDLRASASLILAGLAAEGVTQVSRVYHLDRGYEELEKKLSKLGANIKRVKEGD
ncbi:MAG: UDP-N-acetylglucosamine 1-carboxyvinyltransferase [Deltaproteobacteria bacterium RBG_19FT_COMBO_46_12]|nr:MAG: UDP-N-acetylglucosamine 1-carboxyvinyltransferase [Deltaproteobacteria bacterium RBG_19FT_COMBO_46_12]